MKIPIYFTINVSAWSKIYFSVKSKGIQKGRFKTYLKISKMTSDFRLPQALKSPYLIVFLIYFTSSTQISTNNRVMVIVTLILPSFYPHLYLPINFLINSLFQKGTFKIFSLTFFPLYTHFYRSKKYGLQLNHDYIT